MGDGLRLRWGELGALTLAKERTNDGMRVQELRNGGERCDLSTGSSFAFRRT